MASAFLALALSATGFATPGSSDDSNCETLDTIPNVVTNDIKAGIEKHIEELSEANGGFFPIAFDGKEMQLKLVRVHMEYLANLGPRRHFACVDLASEEGNVYDVDFFLSGDPGNMNV
ncbi:MAG: transglutaminase domain-containing protein, partial [Phycisphaerae bacterium]|nr:transglutaminase domain-containing protein [Phycisphaerae bacterium]